MDVPHIPHATVELAVGKGMRDAVQQHVGRRQYRQAAADVASSGDHRACIGGQPGGQWQDGVVDIDQCPTVSMGERWQLVHPPPVIGIVIGVGLQRFPTSGFQQSLGGIDHRTGHQNIKITDGAARRDGQSIGYIGGTLQQNDRASERGEGLRCHTGLPPGRALAGGDGNSMIIENGAHTLRQAVADPGFVGPCGQLPEQRLRPGDTDQGSPLQSG